MPRIQFSVISLRSILLATAALVVVSWAAYTWGAQEPRTIIRVYDPTGFTATEQLQGSCWTGSLAAQRAGAFRCATGNSIMDPCFALNGVAAVACPEGDPGENRGVQLNLTEPLPQPPDAWTNPPNPADPSPWYMKLEGGGICGVLTGTRPPTHPLGCTIPGGPQPAVCTEPVPMAGSPDVYVSLCGGAPAAGEDVVNQGAYRVTEMWL